VKRRKIIQYGALGIASYAAAACQGKNLPTLPILQQLGKADFSPPEKANLTLGFLPLIDSASLIIAQEKGIFSRYGLTVNLRKQATAKDIEKGLREWRFDAAQAAYGLPLMVQLGKQKAALTSLMVLNLNGSAVTLSRKAWDAGLRPFAAYTNFAEFAQSFRQYIRSLSKPPTFAIGSPFSIDSYLLRYLLAAAGINPEREIEWLEIPPSQCADKLQAGAIQGYCAGAPWNQKAVQQKAGFVACTSRSIWKGHPGSALAAMDGWVKKYPATAKALVAAVLEACQLCDKPETRKELAQILSQSQYLNVPAAVIEPSLSGKFIYSALEAESLSADVPDFQIFHFLETSYLQPPNQANYPWLSQGIWLLTQAIRWHQLERLDYLKDAEKLLDKIYPVELYNDVAKALNITVPQERLKLAPASVFIDNRAFNPSQPVAYLNEFSIRA
jgi:nitrate/nitrite transport system substrate-binding protein